MRLSPLAEWLPLGGHPATSCPDQAGPRGGKEGVGRAGLRGTGADYAQEPEFVLFPHKAPLISLPQLCLCTSVAHSATACEAHMCTRAFYLHVRVYQASISTAGVKRRCIWTLS